MSLSEADTRAKLMYPTLHRRGWTEELIINNLQPIAVKLKKNGTE